MRHNRLHILQYPAIRNGTYRTTLKQKAHRGYYINKWKNPRLCQVDFRICVFLPSLVFYDL